MKKRYVLCGLSARAIAHFVKPLLGLQPGGNDFTDVAVLSAVLDPDTERVEQFNAAYGLKLAHYLPEEFDGMIRRERPDIVLIAGPDDTHFESIMSALKHGCDVIAEKPMVLTGEEAARVREMEAISGRRVTVTFNARYKPLQSRIKELLAGGSLGRIVHIDYSYLLDTKHGSSYFLRWNRSSGVPPKFDPLSMRELVGLWGE